MRYLPRRKYKGGGTASIVGGSAMIAGGAVLAATGVGTPIGVGMMASGVGMTGSGIAQNKAEKEAEALAAKQAAEQAVETEKQKRLSNFQTGNTDLSMRWNNTPTFAKGGRLNSTMNNGEPIEVTEFNGNRHEQGGIPLGANAEVEGGETRVEDYIFSDRINLPGSAKTFAQESKRIERMYSQRKHDPYTRISKERDLNKLQALQEQVKAEQFQQELAGLAQENPEQFQQFTQGIAQQGQQELMAQSQQAAPQISPEEMQMMQPQQGVPQMRYGGTFYGCGGHMKADGGYLFANGGSLHDPEKGTVLYPRTKPLPAGKSSTVVPIKSGPSTYAGDPSFVGSGMGRSMTEYQKPIVPTPAYLKALDQYDNTMASISNSKLTDAAKAAKVQAMLKSPYFNTVASDPDMFSYANGANTSEEYYPLERVGATASIYGVEKDYSDYLKTFKGKPLKGHVVQPGGVSKPSYMTTGDSYIGAYQDLPKITPEEESAAVPQPKTKPERVMEDGRWVSYKDGEKISSYAATRDEIKRFTKAHGGKIYIKPENRGKFNATKERTGKTTEELTHSSNPVTRRRAVFAQNARRWRHAEGGFLDTKVVNGQKMYLIEE